MSNCTYIWTDLTFCWGKSKLVVSDLNRTSLSKFKSIKKLRFIQCIIHSHEQMGLHGNQKGDLWVCMMSRTSLELGAPLARFKASKMKGQLKRGRNLTFNWDSSLEAQILILWGQGKVNVSPPGTRRPLTYLASAQTVSTSITKSQGVKKKKKTTSHGYSCHFGMLTSHSKISLLFFFLTGYWMKGKKSGFQHQTVKPSQETHFQRIWPLCHNKLGNLAACLTASH